MTKRFLSIVLSFALLLSSLFTGTTAAFAEEQDLVSGSYLSITNMAPENKKEDNGGYVSVTNMAEKGEKVIITIHPNKDFKLTKIGYKRDTTYGVDTVGQDDASKFVLPSPMLGTDRNFLETKDCITITSLPVDQTINSVAILDGAAPDKIEFEMPAYPIIIMAEFKLENPEWESWTDFESGKNGLWTYAAVSGLSGMSGEYSVQSYQAKGHPDYKQLRIKSWGENILAGGYTGTDLIIEWNKKTNAVTIPEQSTNLFLANYGEYLMIQDYNSYSFTSNNQSYYDEKTLTFHIPVIYYISKGNFGIQYESMKMVFPGALKYDAEFKDFSGEFMASETDIRYIDGAAQVHATDNDNKTVAIYVGLAEGVTSIPAGKYTIDKTKNPGTVLASSGVVNGSSVTYSFAGNRNSSNQITTPIWFFVSGEVNVSYEGNVMTMVVSATNSNHKKICITITDVIPEKHTITDITTDPHGRIVIDKSPAEEESEVTLAVMPKDGFKLKTGTLKAVYGDGEEKELTLTQNPAEKNKFTFIMPTADVTVKAEFEKTENTFKAVWDSKTKELSFFYDKKSHMGTDISVFDELPVNAGKEADWPYDDIRYDVEKVTVDPSVSRYTGLHSTAYMFSDMMYASDITGMENLKVDNVKNMNRMFYAFGFASSELEKVPDVSAWNTENVTDLSDMFWCYGYSSEKLNFSLDLSDWDLSSTETIGNMFFFAGADAKDWKVCIPYRTGSLENTPYKWYGKNSTVSAAPLTGKQFTLFYPISVNRNIQNGKVRTNVSDAESNTSVSVTVVPNDGFYLEADSLKATYYDGLKIQKLTLVRDETDKQKYTFTMPAFPVTITAEFKAKATTVIEIGTKAEENGEENPNTGAMDLKPMAVMGTIIALSALAFVSKKH